MSEPEEPAQIKMMQRLVELSIQRTQLSEDRSRMSAERSEMSAERSYMNAERTLSVWVRTALAMMVFGMAVNRFGLLLHKVPGAGLPARMHPGELLDGLSFWCGVALVALAVLMATTTGLRFLAYARDWRSRHALPIRHEPYLATSFALMVTVFGLLLLVIMLVFGE